MTRLNLIVLACAMLPAAAFAETALDANDDGVVNLDEVQAVYPAVSADTFMQADTDGDALLSEDELSAAKDEGLIPTEDEG